MGQDVKIESDARGMGSVIVDGEHVSGVYKACTTIDPGSIRPVEAAVPTVTVATTSGAEQGEQCDSPLGIYNRGFVDGCRKRGDFESKRLEDNMTNEELKEEPGEDKWTHAELEEQVEAMAAAMDDALSGHRKRLEGLERLGKLEGKASRLAEAEHLLEQAVERYDTFCTSSVASDIRAFLDNNADPVLDAVGMAARYERAHATGYKAAQRDMQGRIYRLFGTP